MMVMIFVLLGIVAALDIAILLKLHQAFQRTRFPKEHPAKLNELPTVSVCITARNETHAMTQCLERVVASDYPKLEVIVLDDGSYDDTSLLIKSFAYAGVRFIEGKPLPEGWLGKNYAQSLLANEASGEIVLFMDVDTLIERHTVMRLVSYIQQRQVQMVSAIPLRNHRWELSTLMTTMRYFWILMRFSPNYPRAASNVWLIKRELLLEQLETDTSLPLSMLMETTIARKLAAKRHYRLVLSNDWLGIRYEKKWSSQLETSIRLLYPQCHTSLAQVAGLVLLLAITLVPYVAWWWQLWALVLIVMQYVVGYYYLSHIWQRYRFIGAVLVPVTIVQEIILLIVSAYKYKTGTVTWKGRPLKAVKSSANET